MLSADNVSMQDLVAVLARPYIADVEAQLAGEKGNKWLVCFWYEVCA